MLKRSEILLSAVTPYMHFLGWSGRWVECLLISRMALSYPSTRERGTRLISLLSASENIFAHVITSEPYFCQNRLARLNHLFAQNCCVQQSGFTAGRSTVDIIQASGCNSTLLSELHYKFQQPFKSNVCRPKICV